MHRGAEARETRVREREQQRATDAHPREVEPQRLATFIARAGLPASDAMSSMLPSISLDAGRLKSVAIRTQLVGGLTHEISWKYHGRAGLVESKVTTW